MKQITKVLVYDYEMYLVASVGNMKVVLAFMVGKVRLGQVWRQLKFDSSSRV